MWREVAEQLRGFESAVLTGLDEDGYPFSVRCRPQPDPAAGAFRVRVGPGVPIRPGPAGLLCHRHDERLWNLRSFAARGTLSCEPDGWVFRPTALIPGAGIGGLRGFLRFVVESRRRAGRYLAARGLARPRIPWTDINRVKARAQQGGQGRTP